MRSKLARSLKRSAGWQGALLAACALPVAAAEMTSNLPSGQPAGTTIRWEVTGDDPGTDVQRLLVGSAETGIRVAYDFRDSSFFDWTPVDEGLYSVIGEVLDEAGNVTRAPQPFEVLPRTPEATESAVVTPTPHPLVAFYSAPPCPPGASMRVRFSAPGSGFVSRTHLKPCRFDRTMNFYVGGMRPETTYGMQHEILDGEGNLIGVGPGQSFETGPLGVVLPVANVTVPHDARASTSERVLLNGALPPGNPPAGLLNFPFAVDLDGEPIWYNPAANRDDLLVRPGGQGTFYTVADARVVQWDLAGNIMRETTAERLSQQLADLGLDVINNVHHEVRPLPEGRLAVLGSVEKLLEDVQGPGLVDILGDMVLVLDENLQVVWAWNSFDHLDVTRAATIPKSCPVEITPGCPPVLLIEEGSANDWTHSNTITYSPEDGNLLVSVRHQDWIIKLDYQDGAGDGSVLWRLGLEGDFTLTPDLPSAWFTHPHDPNFVAPGRLTVYDNGNLRCEPDTPPGCESRGQVYELDEVNMTARMLSNIRLGEYAEAVGSAQMLANGNVYYDSGLADGSPPAGEPITRVREFVPNGTLVFELELPIGTYRSHRMPDLYQIPAIWGVGSN